MRNEPVIRSLRIPDEVIAETAAAEKVELQRREVAYRGSAAVPAIRSRIIILVDDGIATGSTMRAAIAALRRQHPGRLVVTVPTVAASTCNEIRPAVDELVALMEPEEFYAVGQWYEHFPQTTDTEVIDLMVRARQLEPSRPQVQTAIPGA